MAQIGLSHHYMQGHAGQRCRADMQGWYMRQLGQKNQKSKQYSIDGSLIADWQDFPAKRLKCSAALEDYI